MNKVVIYTRVSSQRQSEEGTSLENQLERCRAYCSMYGYEIVAVLSDKGLSGRSENRPEYQKMMGMVRKRECDIVLTYSLSRFARNTMSTLKAVKEMQANNVNFHSFSEKIDTGSAVGMFFIRVLAALSELESDTISERTKSVLQHKKSLGGAVGTPNYGFTKVGNKKDSVLIPSQTEQYNIELIKQCKQGGLNLSEIAKYLNTMNVHTRCGGEWSAQQVKNVLKQIV